MPWLVIGDFNEIRKAEEKEGGASRLIQQMVQFNNCINYCGLKELDFIGPVFTWLYQRGEGYQIREQLDRAVVSSDWSLLFPKARLFHKSTSVSNHRLLLLKFFEEQKRGRHKKHFRFESMWLKDSRCEGIVTSAWNEGLTDTSSNPIQTCLNACRTKMEAWNWTVFGHVGKGIDRLQKHLEWFEVQPTDPSIIQKIWETRTELNCWLEKENAMWEERSHLDWFCEGDRNTRFFHAKASSRFQKNNIKGILDAQEVW